LNRRLDGSVSCNAQSLHPALPDLMTGRTRALNVIDNEHQSSLSSRTKARCVSLRWPLPAHHAPGSSASVARARTFNKHWRPTAWLVSSGQRFSSLALRQSTGNRYCHFGSKRCAVLVGPRSDEALINLKQIEATRAAQRRTATAT